MAPAPWVAMHGNLRPVGAKDCYSTEFEEKNNSFALTGRIFWAMFTQGAGVASRRLCPGLGPCWPFRPLRGRVTRWPAQNHQKNAYNPPLITDDAVLSISPLAHPLKPYPKSPRTYLKMQHNYSFCNIITIPGPQNDGNFGHIKQIKTRFVWSLGAFAVISW